MSATNLFETDILDLLFTNAALPNVGDSSGLQPSGTAGSFYLSLHTGDDVEEGDSTQTAHEAAYTNYARQAVARSTSGWTVANGTVTNDAVVSFPESGSGPETETDFGLGFASSGAGVLQVYGALGSDIVVNNNITPEFAASAFSISID